MMGWEWRALTEFQEAFYRLSARTWERQSSIPSTETSGLFNPAAFDPTGPSNSILRAFRRHHLIHRFNPSPLLPGLRKTARGAAVPVIHFSAPRGDAFASLVTKLLYANIYRVATLATKPRVTCFAVPNMPISPWTSP